jgi:hypothetical protein
LEQKALRTLITPIKRYQAHPPPQNPSSLATSVAVPVTPLPVHQGIPWSEDEEERLRQSYLSGIPLEEIAKSGNVVVSIRLKYIGENGVPDASLLATKRPLQRNAACIVVV